jgi:membrane associated rhomboid family serine protease
MATLFIYNPWRRQEAWRFITYMFVHVGVMHILMNLIVQIFLGVALELVHCWWRVLLVYLAGVFAGSMGTSLSNPFIYLAGASGGVYALITAHIATIIMVSDDLFGRPRFLESHEFLMNFRIGTKWSTLSSSCLCSSYSAAPTLARPSIAI